MKSWCGGIVAVFFIFGRLLNWKNKKEGKKRVDSQRTPADDRIFKKQQYDIANKAFSFPVLKMRDWLIEYLIIREFESKTIYET